MIGQWTQCQRLRDTPNLPSALMPGEQSTTARSSADNASRPSTRFIEFLKRARKDRSGHSPIGQLLPDRTHEVEECRSLANRRGKWCQRHCAHVHMHAVPRQRTHPNLNDSIDRRLRLYGILPVASYHSVQSAFELRPSNAVLSMCLPPAFRGIVKSHSMVAACLSKREQAKRARCRTV